jgi:cell division protein FtsB
MAGLVPAIHASLPTKVDARPHARGMTGSILDGEPMRFGSLIFALLACGTGGYFAYNLQIGDHGLEARAQLEKRKAVLAGELAGLREVRQRIERDVALLRPEHLDPDMLDERARAILNLAYPDDLIILKRRPPDPYGPFSGR